MLEKVAAFSELWTLVVDGQLDLAEHSIVKFDIDQNVIGTLLQPIFYPNYLEFCRVLPAYPLYLPVDPYHLSFFRWTFTTDQIAYLETEEVGWMRPKGIFWKVVLLEKLFAHLHQPVDQPIEVCNEVDMKIFDNFRTKFPTNFLTILQKLSPLLSFYLHLNDLRLHIVVIVA